MIKYKVKSGDNLSLIAKQNNVSVEDIIIVNKIKDKNKLSINQELIIPESKKVIGKEYTIKKGDTLYDISKKFNVGVNAIKKANEIKSDDIFAGDKVIIPENLTMSILKENKNLKETFKITKKKEDNLKIINDFHSKNKEDYIVIDKKKGKLLLYNNGELKQTLDVGTGKGTSDIITGLTGITNNQTGAGIYTIAKQEEFQNLINNPKNKKLYGKNILGYKNESGQVQGSFLHQIPEGNKERYDKINKGNTHFSQGCINCKKKDFEQVVLNIKPDTKMYILPEEDDNVFEIKNNRLNFTTTKPKNIKGYNFTYDDKGNYLSDKIRQSTYKPLIISKEKLKDALFDNRNTFNQHEILQKNKASLMKDLNIDSDTYDILAKQLMGHIKQETGSSYIRDVGERAFNNFLDVSNIFIPDINIPFTDKKLFGNKSGKTYTAKNSSRGDLQIRYNQIPENIRKKYKVNSPDDLDDIEKAMKVGMFLKKDGLQQVITKRNKLDNLTRENLTDFVPYQYNQAKLLQKNDTNPEKNRYVQNVLNFSNNLKQYGGNSENNMEQIVQQYIQAKGLNEQQAQQLIQELQKLDEQQLQQVVGKMQQQLQSAPMQQAPQQMEEEMMMQYGGKMYTNKSEYLKAKKAYDDSLTLYKQGKIDKEQYLKKIESFGLNRKDQLSESSSFLKTPTNIPSFNKNLKIKPIKQGHLSPIGSSSTRQPNGEYDHKISYLKNSNDVFTLEDGSSLANQIQDGYFLYKKPKQYPQFSEVQNVSFPKETFSYPEFNAPQISLPEEEMYIPPKPREYTTGQESYELNSDYVRRMHEYQKGNKQSPKLIRNQYGGIPVDEDGLYAYPNQNVVVPTQGTGKIQMRGIPHPVAAYDADTMEYLDMMYPDQEYEFDADNILEIPQMQMGGKREAYYTNYLDKYASELDELEILKSNKQAGYLNAPQAKRLAELESRHSKFSKDFKRATKTEIPSSVKDFTVDEEKEFNDLLKKERSDKRKLTIAENKRLSQLKAEQERLDALKPLAETPLKRKKTYAAGTINQIREENAKYLAEAKVRDAKLEKAGFQFKPKDSPAPASVSPVKPSISPIQTSVDPNVTKELLTKQSSIQGRGENIKLLSEKLKDPSLTKTQRDAVFSQLQKLTKDGTSFPKTSKFDFKKSAINAGEEVLDAVTGLARNKWVNRATDVLGTVGGIAGGALAALDIFNTAEEGRGSVGALEFLNDTSPLGKKYQKLYEERLNKDSIWNADTINRELGNAYYEEKLKQPATQQANVNRGVNPTSAISTSQYSGNFPVTSAQNRPSVTGVVDNYSGNTPVEAIGNPNLRTGNKVDTVGGKPVKDFGISNKTDKFGFVSQLKGEKTSKQDNINDYKTWVKDWSTKIDGFDKLPYANQQMVAMQWVKAQRPDVYEGLRKQWEAKGYNKNGKGFEGFLNDGMYANITSSLRPSTLTNNEEPVPNFVDAGFPVESGNSQPTKYTGTIDNTPIALPQESKFSFEDAVNPADAIIGKLDNRDMSGRYLSNMMLRNNEIKLPYFQQVDLKTPQLYQQDITPYINNLYTGYNSAAQNIDMNSAVGQAQALQLNANLDKSINDVSGTVYNQNLKAAIDWENQLTGIYNQQSQLDNQNRAAYSDGVDLVRTNKQNVDNQIDAMAYEHKMNQIKNQNQMMLSTMLHPDFYTTDEGNGEMMLKRKYNPAPKANPNTTSDELEYWKKIALGKKTEVAKFGIGKKKAIY